MSLSAPHSHRGLSNRAQKIKQIFVNHLKFLGPGLVASVAYCDPGNWATDLQAGSSHGYAHLFVILSASVMASVIQVLATRLGFVTGKDLAQHCRDRLYDRQEHKLIWRWGVLYPLYVLCEGGIICTDLAELLGSAIALHALFPRLPLYAGVLLTSLDVFVVLAFFNSYPEVSKKTRHSMQWFELLVSILIFLVVASFVVLLVSVKPDWGKTFEGFIPNKKMIINGGLYVSVSLIGATVMPHSIFLGSKVAIGKRMGDIPDGPRSRRTKEDENDDQCRIIHSSIPQDLVLVHMPPELDSRKKSINLSSDVKTASVKYTRMHLAHASFDIVASLLTLALPINASILIVAAATFYYGSGSQNGKAEDLDLQSAFELLTSRVGAMAGYFFAISLLIAGQAASITVTLAGQIVSEGFLEWRTRPVVRRLVTRMIGIVPSAIVAGTAGLQGVDDLLVGSQVGLSLVLPFVLAPLIIFTSDPKIMRVKESEEEKSSSKPAKINSHAHPVPSDISLDQKNEGCLTDELDKASEEETTTSFENKRVYQVIAWFIFTICSGCNVYAIVQLAQSG